MRSESIVSPTQKIWDVPTRVGHWSLALLFAGAWWTAENGEMYWHRYIGYLIAGLLLFRIYWGFFGSTSARFLHFVRGPKATLSYLRGLVRGGRQPAPPGHNPLGAVSTLVLLGLLLLQVLLGLFAVDVDGMEAGPLSFYISFEMGRNAAVWHEWVFNTLLALVAVHIAAVFLYWGVRGQNLIVRMIHGKGTRTRESSILWFAPVWRLIVGAIMAGLVVWYLQSLDIPL